MKKKEASVFQEIALSNPPSIYEQDNEEPTCRICGCTEDDCSECIEVTGHPCHWSEPDLCSRCAEEVDHTQAAAAANA